MAGGGAVAADRAAGCGWEAGLAPMALPREEREIAVRCMWVFRGAVVRVVDACGGARVLAARVALLIAYRNKGGPRSER